MALGRTLSVVDPSGERVLVDCQLVTQIRLIQTGELIEDERPCRFVSLAAHAATGRWAVGIAVNGEGPNAWTSRVMINGQSVTVPTGRSGKIKGGTLLMLGDTHGMTALVPGVPTTWRDDGVFVSQAPVAFSHAGDQVFVEESSSRELKLWSFDFGPNPRARLVMPAGLSGSEGFDFKGDGKTLVLRSRSGVRLATLGEGPRERVKLGRTLPLARAGMLTPVVLGDSMIFYREGRFDDAGCDPKAPGTFRQYSLSTGKETVWRTDDTCSTSDAFEASSESARLVFFSKGYPLTTCFGTRSTPAR